MQQMWLLLTELRWGHQVPLLLSDNTDSIYLTEWPSKPSVTKHIHNRYHLVRHLVAEEKQHVHTNDMTSTSWSSHWTRSSPPSFATTQSFCEPQTTLHRDSTRQCREARKTSD